MKHKIRGISMQTLMRLVAVLLCAATVCACCACGSTSAGTGVSGNDVSNSDTNDSANKEEELLELWRDGRVVNIRCWNEEFKGFFEKYLWEECVVGRDIIINWIIDPSDGGIYMSKLEEALDEQQELYGDDRLDLFLLEEQYLGEYIESDYVTPLEDIIGCELPDTVYQYTVDACTDTEGKCKGVAIYCCPGALIYRRSIARDVLGTDDPEEVQQRLSTWEAFEQVAEEAAAKGYYMTASHTDTLRTFHCNTRIVWADENDQLQFDSGIEQWIEQTKRFIENEYTIGTDFWGEEKTEQMSASGKTMCFFGPIWYYQYCMPNAEMDGTFGDWAICKGPQAYNWGSIYLLACEGTDNTEMIEDLFEEITDDDFCEKLLVEEKYFPNNRRVVEEYITCEEYGNAALGGQNDLAVLHEVAESLEWVDPTRYSDEIMAELPEYLLPFFRREQSLDDSLEGFRERFLSCFPIEEN